MRRVVNLGNGFPNTNLSNHCKGLKTICKVFRSMQTVHYILRIIHLLFTIVVVGAAGVLILSALPQAKIKVLSVLSGSMEPVMPVGSAVVVKPAEVYRTDEIISFNRGGETLVTHRIVATDLQDGKKVYLTKGDANKDPDSNWIDESQIQGRVLLAIPYLGYVSNWIKTPIGFVSVIVLPAAVLIYGELVAVKNEMLKWWRSAKQNRMSMMLLLVGISFLGLKNTNAWLQDYEVSKDNVIRAWVEDGTEDLVPNEAMPNVKLNEFLVDGTGGFQEQDEWIEIYNLDSEEFNLAGWMLDDIDGGGTSPYVFPDPTMISEHGWLVFSKAETGVGLNNSSDAVRLVRPDDSEADVWEYSSFPEFPDTIGREVDGTGEWKTCGSSSQGESNNSNC